MSRKIVRTRAKDGNDKPTKRTQEQVSYPQASSFNSSNSSSPTIVGLACSYKEELLSTLGNGEIVSSQFSRTAGSGTGAVSKEVFPPLGFYSALSKC
jgi:hypothetical protein